MRKKAFNWIVELLFVITLLVITNQNAKADPIKIGEITISGFTITHDMDDLKQAFEQQWNDGTVVTTVLIIQAGSILWLESKGINNNESRCMTVLLTADQNDLFIKQGSGSKMITCEGHGCNHCEIDYNPDGNPTNCHCEKVGSGEWCEYKTSSGGSYVEQFLSPL
jgi:hypothetical protein